MTSPVNPASPVPPSPAGAPAPGYPMPPAGMPLAEPKRSWFARHKILTGVGAFVGVCIVVSALNGGGGSGASSATTTPASQSVAGAASQETSGQDAAPAPAPEQAAQGDDAGKADSGKTESAASGLTFPGMQKDDVVGNAGDTIDDDGVQVTATPVTAGDATLGPTACSTITITNTSKNTLDVNALDFTLQDPAGAISNTGLLGSSNHLSASKLIAGGSVSGDVCFSTDVSAGGQYVLLYKPTLSLFGHRRAWVNNL